MTDCKDQAERWIAQINKDINRVKDSVNNLEYYIQQLENKKEVKKENDATNRTH